MLENIVRHVEAGTKPLDAAFEAPSRFSPSAFRWWAFSNCRPQAMTDRTSFMFAMHFGRSQNQVHAHFVSQLELTSCGA
jgi:hypothetical protein